MKSTHPDIVRQRCEQALGIIDDESLKLDLASKFHAIKVITRVLLHVSKGKIDDTAKGVNDYKKLRRIIHAFGV
jgi:hypothetical protein